MAHLPFAVKPEFVRGCTMRCVFCGLRHQKWAEQEWQYIDIDFFALYCASLASWRPKVRMEIANRGEQTFHPHFLSLIKVARDYLPRAQILVTTNTDMVVQLGELGFVNFVQDAMRVGVNVFLLHCYTPRRLELITRLFKNYAGTFFDTPGSIQINPYPYRGPLFKAICIKDAVPKPVKESVLLHYHNQGNNANVSDNPSALQLYPNITTPAEPLRRMCPRPFREFPMWYDGSVPICCDDWADQHIIGRFPDKSLPELWSLYDPTRRHLLAKDRDGAGLPCRFCTEGEGKRYGLELNWFGDRS